MPVITNARDQPTNGQFLQVNQPHGVAITGAMPVEPRWLHVVHAPLPPLAVLVRHLARLGQDLSRVAGSTVTVAIAPLAARSMIT